MDDQFTDNTFTEDLTTEFKNNIDIANKVILHGIRGLNEEIVIDPIIVTQSVIDETVAQRNYSMEEQKDYIQRRADLLNKESKIGFLNIIRMEDEDKNVSESKDGCYINLSGVSDNIINALFNYVHHKLSGEDKK